MVAFCNGWRYVGRGQCPRDTSLLQFFVFPYKYLNWKGVLGFIKKWLCSLSFLPCAILSPSLGVCLYFRCWWFVSHCSGGFPIISVWDDFDLVSFTFIRFLVHCLCAASIVVLVLDIDRCFVCYFNFLSCLIWTCLGWTCIWILLCYGVNLYCTWSLFSR